MQFSYHLLFQSLYRITFVFLPSTLLDKVLLTTKMPITELISTVFRPEVAKEGFAAITTSVPKHFSGLPGILFQRVGHIIKHNGNDVSSEYRGILGIGQ